MNKCVFSRLSLVTLMIGSLGYLGAQGQEPDYRVGVKVELVSLFATVLDRRGNLIRGLKASDFEIYDNGVPQRISQFSQEYIPLSVIILLDTSSSMLSGKKLDNAKKSLVQFLKQLLPGDEAMLMTFQTHPRIVHSFTADLDRLKRALKRLKGNGSTALYDAILESLDKVPAARNRRKALLLISDGLNNYGRAQLEETIARLRKSSVELFAIGLETNLPEDMRYKLLTRTVLGKLTSSAGGEAFVLSNPKDLREVCTIISDRMHNQYAFGYYPPKSDDDEWRSIRLETQVPGSKVIPSKTGYYPQIDSARPRSRAKGSPWGH